MTLSHDPVSQIGTGQSRRSVLLGAGAFVSLMAGTPLSRVLAAGQDLRWLTWSTYFSDDLFADFSKETKLSVGSITDNDAELASLKSGGTKEWDLWDCENATCQLHIKEKLVKPLDLSRIPNAAKLFPNLKNAAWTMGPDGQPYFITHIFGIDTIAYRSDKMAKPTTWKALFDPANAGKITMQDYALDGVNIAGMVLFGREGFSNWTDDQLVKIREALVAQRKLVRTYWASESDCRDLFLNGEVYVGTSWVPTANAVKKQGVAVELTIPEEGAMGWSDNLGISSAIDPAREAAAYEVINYCLGETYGLKINKSAPYLTGTTDAWEGKLSADEKHALFLDSPELLAKSNYRRLPANYDKYIELWDKVKLS